MGKSRRVYDDEFKREAVRLVTEGGRGVRQTAENLGIHESLLGKWKRRYLANGGHMFSSKSPLRSEEEEIRRLKRELGEAREEREILKKALAFFSRHSR